MNKIFYAMIITRIVLLAVWFLNFIWINYLSWWWNRTQPVVHETLIIMIGICIGWITYIRTDGNKLGCWSNQSRNTCRGGEGVITIIANERMKSIKIYYLSLNCFLCAFETTQSHHFRRPKKRSVSLVFENDEIVKRSFDDEFIRNQLKREPLLRKNKAILL